MKLLCYILAAIAFFIALLTVFGLDVSYNGCMAAGLLLFVIGHSVPVIANRITPVR